MILKTGALPIEFFSGITDFFSTSRVTSLIKQEGEFFSIALPECNSIKKFLFGAELNKRSLAPVQFEKFNLLHCFPQRRNGNE